APGQVERIVGRIAQIVASVHRATPKLVHRDLKPSNVLVERRLGGKRLLRVTDFGIGGIIAQPLLEQARTSSSLQGNMASALTGAYTPLYASPQQVRGDKPDPRDDVFALGVIWHQLLAGDLTSPAPTGRKWAEALRQKGVSDAAIDLMASCFESDQADRPEDAGVLAQRLVRLAQDGAAKNDPLDLLPLVAPVPEMLPIEIQPRAASTKTGPPPIELVRVGESAPRTSSARAAAPALRAGRGKPAAILRQKNPRATPQRAPKRKWLTFAGVVCVLLAVGALGEWVWPGFLAEVLAEVRERWQKAFPPKPERQPGDIITNSLGMKLAWIPPGAFMMGSPPDEVRRNADETQHKVTLTKGFYLGVYQVNQEQWQALMGNNPSHFKEEKDLPVEMVAWADCQEFLKRLSEKEGQEYRLPTEAEWEYACRAGTTTPYYFGETISTDQANYDGTFVYGKGKQGVYRQKTTPGGSFPPSAWGLGDMHGNVWEWCADWYGAYPTGEVVDPQGPPSGEFHVLRGGSYFDVPADVRSASRLGHAPSLPYGTVGFRVATTFTP
ncbi:MAG TPA: SUMF1/EgtB/PvdO family nonheme iron enzyme, partial [Gemmataceae bacterium]|nr:SUMF1/EgtB/PvdO family nonheme iron enzyme [Gemmataceae bacterium]